MKIKLYTEENDKSFIFLQMDIFDDILTVDLDDVAVLYDHIINNEPIIHNSEEFIFSIYSSTFRSKVPDDFFNIMRLTKLSEYETEIRIVSANVDNLSIYKELLILNNEQSNFIINILISLVNVILFYDNINDLYMKLPEGCCSYSVDLEC